MFVSRKGQIRNGSALFSCTYIHRFLDGLKRKSGRGAPEFRTRPIDMMADMMADLMAGIPVS